MTEPKIKISAQMVEAQPVLQEFTRYIESHDSAPVDPARIRIVNPQPDDGIVQFQYDQANCQIGEKCFTYVAMMDASARTLMMRHGWGNWTGSGFLPPKDETGKPLSVTPDGRPTTVWMDEPVPLPIAGTCQSLRALGGSDEAGFPAEQCSDQMGEVENSAETANGIATGLGSFFGLDIMASFLRYPITRNGKHLFPMTRWIIRQLSRLFSGWGKGPPTAPPSGGPKSAPKTTTPKTSPVKMSRINWTEGFKTLGWGLATIGAGALTVVAGTATLAAVACPVDGPVLDVAFGAGTAGSAALTTGAAGAFLVSGGMFIDSLLD